MKYPYLGKIVLDQHPKIQVSDQKKPRTHPKSVWKEFKIKHNQKRKIDLLSTLALSPGARVNRRQVKTMVEFGA